MTLVITDLPLRYQQIKRRKSYLAVGVNKLLSLSLKKYRSILGIYIYFRKLTDFEINRSAMTYALLTLKLFGRGKSFDRSQISDLGY